MERLRVTIPETPETVYPIVIGSGLFEKWWSEIQPPPVTKIGILIDARIASTLGPRLLAGVPVELPVKIRAVEIDEERKCLEVCSDLWQWLLDERFDRHSLILNVGGGTIGDLGGFVASTFMRGIPFMQVPTTLLSQVDASVGGKLGINFAGKKNMVGTITQPTAVMIDTGTLRSLPVRELRSGFAEIVKHALIADDLKYLEETVRCGAGVEGAGGTAHWHYEDDFALLISRSCEIKRAIVEEDPTERGLRKLLNLGHTIGHAVEAIGLESDTRLLHGEAIAIGLRSECEIAAAMGRISSKFVARTVAALESLGLPTRPPPGLELSPERLLNLILHDKKNKGGEILWVLPQEQGRPEFNVTAPQEVVEEVLSRISTI